jgi:hypothetical protein
MRKRSNNQRLLLSKETVRNLVPGDLDQVAGGIICARMTRGVESICDCSGSATASGTCTDCSTIQY